MHLLLCQVLTCICYSNEFGYDMCDGFLFSILQLSAALKTDLGIKIKSLQKCPFLNVFSKTYCPTKVNVLGNWEARISFRNFWRFSFVLYQSWLPLCFWRSWMTPCTGFQPTRSHLGFRSTWVTAGCTDPKRDKRAGGAGEWDGRDRRAALLVSSEYS